MITIKEHNLDFISISIKAQDRSAFEKLLLIVKSYPKVLYNPKNCEWYLPIIQLSSIVSAYNNIGEEIDMPEILKQKSEDAKVRNEKLLKLKKIFRGVKFDIPSLQPGTELYPFQKVGAGFLYLKKRVLCADCVGLGKTITSLAAIEKRFSHNALSRCLVICPNSLKIKWHNEIKKFFGKDSIVIIGAKKNRMEQYEEFAESYRYAIISYDTLRSDVEYIKCILSDSIDGKIGIICDEIQYLKNYNVKRSAAVKSIVYLKNVDCVYGLSATYIENGLENLFGIFNIIDINVFGENYHRYVNRYIKIDFWGRVLGYKNVEEVVDKIDTYNIRRHKEQVFDQLPKVNYIDYRVELTASQRSIYNDIEDKIVEEINDPDKALKVARSNAMTQLGFLLQSTLSSELFEAGKDSSKLDELIEIIGGMDTESKIVIFCHYVKMVEIITRELNNAGYDSIYMHGQSELGESSIRQKTIDEWSNSENTRCLVTSDILAEGVDLVAANYLVNFDLLWNPAKMEQRGGRIDRISQKAKQITIINLIAKDTVEERVFKKLEERKKIINTVVDGGYESDRMNMMSTSNLKELFKKRK